jgi:hypothetical protein
MQVQVKNPKAKWYTELMDRFERLMSTQGIPENPAREIKQLVLAVAREQYMAGNRSGIRWAREQAEARPTA